MTHDLRILMLEDSAGDAALLERELRQGGMSFLSRRVETRDAFLAQLEEFDPDLVISDYRLPAFDGLQALELVRARGPELPFILISGHVGEERATEALKNGATDFILKGRVGRLVPAVQRALREVRERTERRRLEERFRLIVEATPNAMIMINTDGMIDMVNGETERMFGYEREELLGRGIEMLLPERFRSHHPQMREAFFATPRARRMGTGDALFGRRRDGSEIPLEIGLSPIDTGDGIQVLSVIVDITARYEIEREREQKQRELLAARDAAERASRAKSHFLAGMSHELRTPLNGVLGYARLLRMEGGLNAVQAARVDAMLVAGNHLLEMIHCVLDLSEIETERALSQATDVDLREIASACLDLVRPTAAAKDLVLSLSVPSDMPDRVVLDPMRLRQVLLNLLSNAVKFTNRGMVELRASAVDDGKLLRFEVADTGPGIPDDQRHRLFQNFERLGADKRGSIEGAGLGLSLSARLATLISGRIGHVPNPGGGSIFWLELPLVRSTAPAPAQGATLEPEEPSPRRSLHVLVVDDVAMNREIAASFLEATGHKVMSVEGGAEAIAAVAETDFSVVLMDVRMPEMDGLEATRRIRALGGARGRVPIVALTAQAFTEQVAECRKAGMDSHLAKPFDLDQLVAAVVRATSMGRADAEVPDPVASAAPVDPEPEAPLLGLELQVLDSKAFERTSSFLAPTMVDSHMRTIAGKVEALLRGLRGPDAISRHGTELGSEAHSLAGSAGMFGFERIAALGRRFEKAVQSGSAEAPALAAGLIAALEATLQIIYDRTSTAVDA